MSDIDTAQVRAAWPGFGPHTASSVMIHDLCDTIDALRAALAEVTAERPPEAPEWFGHFQKAATEIKELRAKLAAVRALCEANTHYGTPGMVAVAKVLAVIGAGDSQPAEAAGDGR